MKLTWNLPRLFDPAVSHSAMDTATTAMAAQIRKNDIFPELHSVIFDTNRHCRLGLHRGTGTDSSFIVRVFHVTL